MPTGLSYPHLTEKETEPQREHPYQKKAGVYAQVWVALQLPLLSLGWEVKTRPCVPEVPAKFHMLADSARRVPASPLL